MKVSRNDTGKFKPYSITIDVNNEGDQESLRELLLFSANCDWDYNATDDLVRNLIKAAGFKEK